MSETNPSPVPSPEGLPGEDGDARGAAGLPGPLCLVGGAEWTEGCTFDQELWEMAGRPEVVVLPTAAAYEHPARHVEAATSWFATFGAKVRGLMVLARPDAEEAEAAGVVADARFVYLSGGSPLHLRSVLKDTALWSAVGRAWASGAVIAGSSAGAMVLGDPMVDPRGGALTLGLGLIDHLALLPHYDTWSQEKAERTVELATGHLRIAAIDERTALIRDPDGTWRTAGAGGVIVYVDGRPAGIEALSSGR
ncbi:MAG: Type 1 glutamine amidotransferase-like domain-containing protein [Actinomycetota bacterium]|nr:Type 1 glutamine amidotransferase-like domain-containing protein [Actinomycetota bacterium]